MVTILIAAIALILLVLYIRAWKINRVNKYIRDEISYAIFKHTK